MNSNTQQLNENYKFRISYVWYFFKDMISASGEVDDKELNSRIEKIRQEQDKAHIESLEKEINNYVTKRGPKVKDTNFKNVKNVKNNIQTKQEQKEQTNTLEDNNEKIQEF